MAIHPARRRPAPWLLRCLIGAVSLVAVADGRAQDVPAIPVIPRPVTVEVTPGAFRLAQDTEIRFESAAAPAAELLRGWLKSATGMDVPAVPAQVGDAPGGIHLALIEDSESTSPEAYRLTITPDAVELSAGDPRGLLCGCQTLRQLLPATVGAESPAEPTVWRLPCVTIEDAPRFVWRGLMLDCSRTFQSVDYLRATIDRLAYYKLNVLHLHLTDDQGWRVEIRSHPELTAKGARFPQKWGEPASHQGFYTQEQLKDLVAYAAARNVTIVPEIEMPGHTLAALACYPHLSCSGGPFEIHPFFKGPGIHEDIFCAGNDEVFAFLEEVLGEVCTIFPSPFIHIGGDEAPKARWQACPKCQARMKEEGLASEAELQSWFIQQAASMLRKRGRTLIGWDEIAEGGLAAGAAVMSWRGTSTGITAAQAGHPVVMSPTSHCYFDYSYERLGTRRVFAFDPVAGLDGEAVRQILGIQANFWSHIDREPGKVDAQLFPRLLALAERAWSPAEASDWADFERRTRAQFAWLDETGVTRHPESLAGESAHPKR